MHRFDRWLRSEEENRAIAPDLFEEHSTQTLGCWQKSKLAGDPG